MQTFFNKIKSSISINCIRWIRASNTMHIKREVNCQIIIDLPRIIKICNKMHFNSNIHTRDRWCTMGFRISNKFMDKPKWLPIKCSRCLWWTSMIKCLLWIRWDNIKSLWRLEPCMVINKFIIVLTKIQT